MLSLITSIMNTNTPFINISSATTKAWNTDITAARNCYIYATAYTRNATLYVTIGGRDFLIAGAREYSDNQGAGFYVKKGQVYKAHGGASDQSLIEFALL